MSALLSSICLKRTVQRRSATESRRRRFQLRMESLEDRRVPSTVSNLADSGPGSLRDAIANTPAGGTIDFQAGLSGTIKLTSGELVIDHNLTISGPGASAITVSGANSSRVFDIPLSMSAAISGLTIADGYTTGGLTGWGGGIENRGTLSVTDCTITGNFAEFGGGGIDNHGPLTVTGCVLSNNTTTASLGGGGGGIYSSNGNVTVAASSFSGNSGQQGGAIINNGGTLNVDTSTFSQNHAGVGGGVFNVFGTGTITNSTFANNAADTSAGYAGGGVANSGNGKLTVSGCTFTGNSAGTATINGGGGAVYNQDSILTLVNSTLYGNSAHLGGGIDNHFSVSITVLNVSSSTIVGNSAGVGGGVNNSGGTLGAFNTIVAGNTAPGSPDVGGALASQGHNLIGNGTGGSGYASTDHVGTAASPIDPMLGPLQNNGGPTQTMALLAGSPAIDGGDNANAPAFDQRGPGYPRIVGSTIDIGAYESQVSSNPTLVMPVFTNLSSPIIKAGTTSVKLSGHIAAGTAVPKGDTVSITLNGVTQTAVVDGKGNFSSRFDTSALTSANSPYSVVYAFAGDGKSFSAATGSGTLTVRSNSISGNKTVSTPTQQPATTDPTPQLPPPRRSHHSGHRPHWNVHRSFSHRHPAPEPERHVADGAEARDS